VNCGHTIAIASNQLEIEETNDMADVFSYREGIDLRHQSIKPYSFVGEWTPALQNAEFGWLAIKTVHGPYFVGGKYIRQSGCKL
jgi:hypothetical protein